MLTIKLHTNLDLTPVNQGKVDMLGYSFNSMSFVPRVGDRLELHNGLYVTVCAVNWSQPLTNEIVAKVELTLPEGWSVDEFQKAQRRR